MSPFYTLIGQTPVPTEDVFEVARLIADITSRKVKDTYLGDAGIHVSTVFLAIDTSCGFGGGPPLTFETMVFWPEDGAGEEERCSTWLEAEEQHEVVMVRYVMTPAALWWYCMRMLRTTLQAAWVDLQRSVYEVGDEV